jgi:hypothetical protein
MKKSSCLFFAVFALVFAVSEASADGYGGGPDGSLQASNQSGAMTGADDAARAARQAALIEQARREDADAAVGHFARSRSLLIQAVREFDLGYRLARPDSLIDSASWREGLIQRARDIERVLDPQPRITNRGVQFEPDTRLLGATKKVK